MSTRNKPAAPRPTIRCAIYTRKSTEEGLDQEFNSLDAQRESGEAYIRSMASEGWICLSDRYDDGGFTGGNMDRPAFKRLMADIEAGKIDCVVTYKVDRLSRSLLDFTQIMQLFERYRVSFISVTQSFNTATSMGRLVLNVLLSFAQFEREIISERTRDKIAAARRKGKWSGGLPILGYDVDPQGFKLVVNEPEAQRVRTIFQMYLDADGLLPVVEELARRGWRNKKWTTRKGKERGGKPFAKNSLWNLLTNIAYLGKVRYKSEVHEGEHPGIIEADMWQRVQVKLKQNGQSGGRSGPSKFGAILKGLIHCVPCAMGMTPTHSTRQGKIRYRYYVCSNAQQKGWQTCPTKSIPALEVERYVVSRIAAIGRDPGLIADTLHETGRLARERNAVLATERQQLQRELATYHDNLRQLVAPLHTSPDELVAGRLADLHDRIAAAEQRLRTIDVERTELERRQITEADVTRALADFAALWETLTAREQAEIMQLLIEQIDYDGRDSSITIAFRPNGLKTLLARANEEVGQ